MNYDPTGVEPGAGASRSVPVSGAVALPDDFEPRVRDAIKMFWEIRNGGNQAHLKDAHMTGFVDLMGAIVETAGIPRTSIFTGKGRTAIPGYFRATKEWDLIVIHERKLVAAMEWKSQLSSFGNNLNNRVEECIGNAVDLRRAHDAGYYGPHPAPLLGYLMMVADVPESRSPVRTSSRHFPPGKDFSQLSYLKRYELFVRRLVTAGLYDHGIFVSTEPASGTKAGHYAEPAADLSFRRFAEALLAHSEAAVGRSGVRQKQLRL